MLKSEKPNWAINGICFLLTIAGCVATFYWLMPVATVGGIVGMIFAKTVRARYAFGSAIVAVVACTVVLAVGTIVAMLSGRSTY